ncbi:response regulator [Candidatus Omnitrophota bacterium]
MVEKLKILVVDDEPDASDLFKDLFTKKDYDVECASSGPEAMEIVDKIKIDVVLLDIRMPVMDGIEALAKLKQMKPNLPVVMLTAYGYDDNLISRALELGATGYISKNLPLTQIVHTFETLLAAVKRRKEGSSE